MDDLDFDPGTFVTGSGVWHIMDRNAEQTPQGILSSIVTRKTSDGRSVIVAFTDEDLAQKFIESQAEPEWVVYLLDDKIEWLIFLENLVEFGYGYIEFDPDGSGRAADSGTILDLIKNVRESSTPKSQFE